MRNLLKSIAVYIRAILIKIRLTLLKINNKGLIVGEGCIIELKTKIYSTGNRIVIGNNVYLRSRAKFYQAGMPFYTTLLVDVKGGFIKIGNNCRINGAYIHAQSGITIGDNCVIASGVNIMDSNGHELYSSNRTVGRDKPAQISIGNNVWIGVNAVILKDSVIGDNCVIGAGSIVKGNFPDNSLIMGNPATIVKKLDINL